MREKSVLDMHLKNKGKSRSDNYRGLLKNIPINKPWLCDYYYSPLIIISLSYQAKMKLIINNGNNKVFKDLLLSIDYEISNIVYVKNNKIK